MLNAETFFYFITQDSTVWFFVLLIVIVALFPLKQSFWNIGKVNKDLKIASKVFFQIESKKDFYNNFESISTKISNLRWLKAIWNDFISSTYYLTYNETDNHSHRAVYLSHRPYEYFTKQSILGQVLNINQFYAYPNYLIGIGLTFTFIGLAAALHIAQQGLAHGEGQAALSELLKVASVKFFSSIAGISCSLFISFIQKKQTKEFHKKLNNFCSLIENCTEYKPTEKLLFESIQEQTKQTFALQSMANDISRGIGDVLNNQLPVSVAKALEPLAHEIRELAHKFSGSNENALEKVLDEFIEQLRKSSADDMQGLVNGVNTLKVSLEKLVDNIELMSTNFGSNTKESTDRLMRSLENFANTFVPVQNGIAEFGKTLNSLESIAESIQNASGNISGAASINTQSMSNLAGTVNQITENIAPIQDLLGNLSLSLQKINESSLKLDSAGDSISLAVNGFNSSAQNIENASSKFNDNITLIQTVIDGLNNTTTNLEKSSSDIRQSVLPLSQTSEQIQKALKVTQETELRLIESQKQMGTLLNSLDSFTEKMPTILSQYEDRFTKVDHDLANAFSELAKGSEEFKNSIIHFIQSFDSQFEKALSHLSAAIHELQEEREETYTNFIEQKSNGQVDADTRIT
ncbi:Chromosome partition protein Smc [Legionella jordanis]|uniref:Chromosome partition protein Smc n=1 Tax=Legionella jordanis TaxID=456 RepID=A0A0W0VFE1_9GAMM|nr:hypothetical protein [Legionella jordanis]KTD18860.1 Chromosome partition protein Smc [Legionella jordanis]VEH12960.1 chromosome segregation protein SMC [Legionella jordanis]